MKYFFKKHLKKILIGALLALIVIAVGIWGYILINDPQIEVGSEQNTDLPSAPAGDGAFEDASSDTNERSVSLSAPLVQLTERPVAGATFANVDDATHVRYIERGTGHVFQISLESGEESRISGTTIPRTVDAVWSPSGSRAALTIEQEAYETETHIAHLTTTDSGEQTLDGFSLSEHVHSPAFDTVGDTLFYAATEDRRTIGYAENLKTGERSTVFEVPFTQIEVLWGDTIHIYNKPTAHSRGFLYEVDGDSLTRIAGGRGLMAEKDQGALLISRYENRRLQTDLHIPGTASTTELSVPGYMEKCDFTHSTSTRSMWCIGPIPLPERTHPDEWYKGALALNGYLWEVDLDSTVSTFAHDPEESTERSLDATDVTVDLTDSYLIFRNKTDSTLWLYDLEQLD